MTDKPHEPEHIQYPWQNCARCARPFSQSWPRGIKHTKGPNKGEEIPYREMMARCESTLEGNGWYRCWFAPGWLCPECARARAERCGRWAPRVRVVGAVLAVVAAGLVVWGVLM